MCLMLRLFLNSLINIQICYEGLGTITRHVTFYAKMTFMWCIFRSSFVWPNSSINTEKKNDRVISNNTVVWGEWL